MRDGTREGSVASKIIGGICAPFRKIGGFVKKHKIISIIIAIALILAIIFFSVGTKRNNAKNNAVSETAAVRMTISESISGSSIVEANDEYSVVPLVTGEILTANFEEGDIVEKDQVLYEIDSSDALNSIKSSDLSIQKAENSSSDAYDAISDLTVKAPFSGTITSVYVSVGDEVSNGAKIADMVDNKTLKATIPFNTADAQNISVGESASVTLVSSGSVLTGKVTAVSSGSETINGSMKVSYVTVEVSNPGAVLAGESVTALIGGYACNDVGEIEVSSTKTITAKVSGTIVRVPVVKGDSVSAGATIATITSESVDSQVRNADISLQEAYLQREKLYDQLENYTIKSPISGTVVRKNKKAGDKLESGSSSSDSSNVLAVIYDMSSLCFQLDVDELDIKKMAVGQEVAVTADAVEGRTYTGVVENVSVNGTIGTNGVTTYPVKVRITDFDDNLLPGMNIEATITVKEAENAIAVPVTSVNRGNTVYVKGDKEDEKDMAPEGFKTVQVEIGISNDSFVEIISGVNEGDIVYVTPTAGDEQQMMFGGMQGGMFGGMQGGGMPGGGMQGGNRAGGMQGGNRTGGMQGGGMPGGGGMR